MLVSRFKLLYFEAKNVYKTDRDRTEIETERGKRQREGRDRDRDRAFYVKLIVQHLQEVLSIFI